MMDNAAIAQELHGIQEFLQERVSPMEEEMQRLTASVTNLLEQSRDVRRAELLNSVNGRLRVNGGKYEGMDALDIAIQRSRLRAQVRNPEGINPNMLEEWGQNLTAAMDSTTTGSGDELVQTQEARNLWDDVNLETAIASLFNTIQMPSNPFLLPVQLGDVNWYPGTENVATKSTTPATARRTLTAHELVAEIPSA